MGGRRKQTMRRLNQRMRLNAVRREVPHPAGVPKSASVLAPRSAGCRSWLGPLIAVPLLLVFISWLLWDQAQIGRVLLFGVPAAGTVVAVNQCSRATAGDVTIVFTDARGDLRRVKHSSYTPGCFFTYHEGEAITVRYVPSDPGVLMTQPELGGLWLSDW